MKLTYAGPYDVAFIGGSRLTLGDSITMSAEARRALGNKYTWLEEAVAADAQPAVLPSVATPEEVAAEVDAVHPVAPDKKQDLGADLPKTATP